MGTLDEHLPGAGTEIRPAAVTWGGIQDFPADDRGGLHERRTETPDCGCGKTGRAELPLPVVQGVQGTARAFQRDRGGSAQGRGRETLRRPGLCGDRREWKTYRGRNQIQ